MLSPLQPPRHPVPVRPSPWLGYLAALAILVSIVGFGIYKYRRISWESGESARQSLCRQNLRQIGLAIVSYAQANSGAYPSSLAPLLADSTASPRFFTCPSACDDPPAGTTPAQRMASFRAGHHGSFIYVSSRLSSGCPNDTVVAFEDPANHQLAGANVLRADGSVGFYPIRELAPLIADLQAGRNPPPRHWLSEPDAQALYDHDWKPVLHAMKDGTWAASLPPPVPATQPSQW